MSPKALFSSGWISNPYLLLLLRFDSLLPFLMGHVVEIVGPIDSTRALGIYPSANLLNVTNCPI